jgi:hypothetical protein
MAESTWHYLPYGVINHLFEDQFLKPITELAASSPALSNFALSASDGSLSKIREAAEMAENKTKPTEVSVASYIDALTDASKRADAKALVKLMQSASGEKPKMWGPAIVGFGSYHYKYDSGREGDMPLIGFSPRKAANVLYGAIGFTGAEALLAKLGKHTTGKGCLYIKKLAEVDQKVLESLLTKSVAAKRARQSS